MILNQEDKLNQVEEWTLRVSCHHNNLKLPPLLLKDKKQKREQIQELHNLVKKMLKDKA